MMPREDRQTLRLKLNSLLAIAEKAHKALIVTHNDPDPDAIGAAFGLSELLQQKTALNPILAYRGIIGRAENKAMVKELSIPLQPFSEVKLEDFDLIALVDSQPGAGNQPFTVSQLPHVVIDHHPLRPETAQVPFADVRTEYSATATIVTWYVRSARIRLSSAAATALFYGIKADTLGLSRISHPLDAGAYVYLQQCVDTRALITIENASVSPDYYRALDRALHRTSLHDGLLVARLGEMRYPDMAAEIADFLKRLEGTKVVVAIGRYARDVIFSVRSPEQEVLLDELVQKVVRQDGTAGGHDYMAAGRVPASLAGAPENTEEEIVRRFAEAMGVDEHRGKWLLGNN